MARQERDAHINEVAALRARLAAAEAELAKLRPLDAAYIEGLERGCEERDRMEKERREKIIKLVAEAVEVLRAPDGPPHDSVSSAYNAGLTSVLAEVRKRLEADDGEA